MSKFSARAAIAPLSAMVLLAACNSSSIPGNISPPNPPDTPPVTPVAGDNIFLSIVPPGSNGNSAGAIGTPLAGGDIPGTPIPAPPVLVYPKNFRDQLDMYGDLAQAKPGLKGDTCVPPKSIGEHQAQSDQACNYFKPAGITLAAADEVSSRTLTAPNGKSVTIQRDGWGVPYITGEDRQSAEYGMGFAAAQDRLWLFDILRNVGRGQVSKFLGPGDALYSMDNEFGVPAGYSEDELTNMVNNTVAKLGTLGPMFLQDTQSFVTGMNAYITYLQGAGVAELPPEYATLAAGLGGIKFPPAPFTVNDIVANAVLIQSALGRGGGGEASNLRLLQALDPSITGGATTIPKAACETWRDLRNADLPDTPHTIEKTFATQSPATLDESCPQALPPGAAVWDVGSYKDRAALTHAAGLPGALPTLPGGVAMTKAARKLAGHKLAKVVQKPATLYASADANSMRELLNRLGLPKTTSNWIAVNGSETKSGHPITVMGPQTGYDVPQLLWESAVVSKGGTPYEFAARGITTVNLPYVVIGHGLDFGWSPTSAESDIQDIRVSKLCNLDGSAPSRDDGNGDGFPDADGYLYKGQCVRLYKRVDTWTAYPTVASIALGGGPTPENVKRYVLRTHYGPVTGTALVKGQPVVVSLQRSTFLSDVDTAAPFALLTTTGKPMTQKRFKQLFNSMSSVFNWLYVDTKDTAYIQSGLYPVRAAGVNPDLPQWGDGNYEWGADQNLPADFFTLYGGDAAAGGKPYPARTMPVAQGDPLDGYFEWQGYLPLASHIQDTNPTRGYMASWNNSGAPGWWAADSNGTFGGTHRVSMLMERLAAFKASGRKHDIASMIEVMGDTAYTDQRGFDTLPLLLQLMKQGSLTADQQAAADLLQQWIDDGSSSWISGTPGLGAYRRDRDGDGVYDHRMQVVLMDAWYPHLIDGMLPQMVDIEKKGVSLLTARLDAPRAQGSAYQEGWYQHMQRMLRTVLNVPGHVDYRALKCAGTGVAADCRAAVLSALDQALSDLGGLSNKANWDGSTLVSQQFNATGHTVEDYDSVRHTSFSFAPVPPIPWINRPTFQQAVEIYKDRDQQ